MTLDLADRDALLARAGEDLRLKICAFELDDSSRTAHERGGSSADGSCKRPRDLPRKPMRRIYFKQRIGEVAAGLRVGPERATIDDLCNLVLEDYRVRNLRDAPHVECRYRANVAPVLDRLLASRFGPAQV